RAVRRRGVEALPHLRSDVVTALRWVSKRLDFSVADWLYAAAACVTPGPTDAAERVERVWSPEGDAVSGLSVRTLFDLYLAANRDVHGWARGDRVAFTALTVGDMPRVARAHGFEVASVDLDPATTEPAPEALAALLTPH